MELIQLFQQLHQQVVVMVVRKDSPCTSAGRHGNSGGSGGGSGRDRTGTRAGAGNTPPVSHKEISRFYPAW